MTKGFNTELPTILMKKITHLLMGLATLILFGFVMTFPLHLVFFAFIGMLMPELDFRPRKLHHKLFHNIWFLVAIVLIASSMGAESASIIMLSIGFFSHMISDALTHGGIVPLWPIKSPKFNGPIKSGSLGEYLLILILMIMIYTFGIVA
jgi:membrane-bound metal-dependent hydrolase YbcI (DUF457 family)